MDTGCSCLCDDSPTILVNISRSEVVLAVSAHFHSFPEKADWIAEQGLAMEYSPDPSDLTTIAAHLAPYLKRGVSIRHHAYFPHYEIADPDRQRADLATTFHFRYLEAIRDIGEKHVTVHIGLNPTKDIDPERGVSNLGQIVEHASTLGISVALENLKHGLTSNPATVVDWARRSGAGITLDVGHAVSCEGVRSGRFTVQEIIEMFEERLQEVHLYESETDVHHAPRDMSVLGHIVDRLLKTNCRWWTIELDSLKEIETTRDLIIAHFLPHRPCLEIK
jgi:sugar phosphate isomerase/epimerase